MSFLQRLQVNAFVIISYVSGHHCKLMHCLICIMFFLQRLNIHALLLLIRMCPAARARWRINFIRCMCPATLANHYIIVFVPSDSCNAHKVKHILNCLGVSDNAYTLAIWWNMCNASCVPCNAYNLMNYLYCFISFLPSLQINAFV